MRTKTAVAPPEPPESPALTLEGGPDLYLSSITAEVPEVLLSRIARWFAERKCVTPVRLSADRPYETNAGESLRYLGAHDDKFIFAGVVIERGKTNGYRCYVAPYPLDDAIFRRWKKLFVEDEPRGPTGQPVRRGTNSFATARANLGNAANFTRPELMALRSGSSSLVSAVGAPADLPKRILTVPPARVVAPSSPLWPLPKPAPRSASQESEDLVDSDVDKELDDLLGETQPLGAASADNEDPKPTTHRPPAVPTASKEAAEDMTTYHRLPASERLAEVARQQKPVSTVSLSPHPRRATSPALRARAGEREVEADAMLLIMWDHRRGDLFDITDKNMNALADDPRFPDSIRARSKDTRKSAAKCQQGMAARGLLEPVRSTTLRTADGKLFRLIAYRFTAETIRLLKSDVDDELPPPTDDDEQPSDPPPPAASPEAAPEVGEAAATPDVTDPPVEPESDHVPGATVADRLLLRPFGPAIGNLTANVATRLGRYLMNRSETQQLISKLQTLDREAEQLREEASEEEQATMDGFDRLIEKGIEQ